MQTVTRHAAVTNYASTAKPSPTPTLFGVSLGSLTARAEAQVVRLATIYAMWAGTGYIELEHLTAAVAIQEFCHQSVEYIFGDTLGDPVADTILAALKAAGQSGLTRTDINNLFSRNVPASQIARALGELSRRGLAAQHKGEAVNGRPPEIWMLVERSWS
jgi:hypothetical protein